MAFKFSKKEIKSKKLNLKLEIELIDSAMTAEEAEERISYLLNVGQSKVFSELVVFLIRETKSDMWELKLLEIKNDSSS